MTQLFANPISAWAEMGVDKGSTTGAGLVDSYFKKLSGPRDYQNSET